MSCPCSDCTACPEAGGCCVLVLTEDELTVLRRFAETPFLPLAREEASGLPLCPELEGDAGRVAAVLRNLESKGLLTLDDGVPLSNYDYTPCAPCSVCGSMALTAAGQDALEALEIQGIAQ